MKSTRTTHAAVTAVLESLETRRMFAAGVSLNDEGMLLVTGTGTADTVTLSLNADDDTQLDVNLNDRDTETFSVDSITSIRIVTGGGSDTIELDESNGPINIPAAIFAGGGNDLVTSGSGDDVIDAGGGRDTIFGGSGDDKLIGGAGNDSLEGDSDSDILVGGAGADALAGGQSDDDLEGGAGLDDLTGGDGADAFALGNGKDTLEDKTDGVDRSYKPFSMAQLPSHYKWLFSQTFPNSIPLGVRMNDDHTFVMIYRFNGDGQIYHVDFTYTGEDPLHNLDNVQPVRYEVAIANLGPLTAEAFFADHPDAIIKEIFNEKVDHTKYTHIRYKEGDSDSQWAVLEWLDNELPDPNEPQQPST